MYRARLLARYDYNESNQSANDGKPANPSHVITLHTNRKAKMIVPIIRAFSSADGSGHLSVLDDFVFTINLLSSYALPVL